MKTILYNLELAVRIISPFTDTLLEYRYICYPGLISQFVV